MQHCAESRQHRRIHDAGIPIDVGSDFLSQIDQRMSSSILSSIEYRLWRVCFGVQIFDILCFPSTSQASRLLAKNRSLSFCCIGYDIPLGGVDFRIHSRGTSTVMLTCFVFLYLRLQCSSDPVRSLEVCFGSFSTVAAISTTGRWQQSQQLLGEHQSWRQAESLLHQPDVQSSNFVIDQYLPVDTSSGGEDAMPSPPLLPPPLPLLEVAVTVGTVEK